MAHGATSTRHQRARAQARLTSDQLEPPANSPWTSTTLRAFGGRLDVVFAKRPLGTSRGRLVWREPLVWAAADTFDVVPGAALPLALYRERSVSREAALAALNDSELTWEIIYTSPSLTGVRAAALAGLAITPLPASAIVAGLRILGSQEGLPRLPDLEFAIYEKARPEKAAAALAAALLALGQSSVRPTI